MKQRVADNLKRLRTAGRFKQREVAEGVGISVRKYQSYEEGRASPPLETLIYLAHFHSVTVNDLLTENFMKDGPSDKKV